MSIVARGLGSPKALLPSAGLGLYPTGDGGRITGGDEYVLSQDTYLDRTREDRDIWDLMSVITISGILDD